MKLANILRYLYFILSAIAFSAGVVLISGFVYDYVPYNMRLVCGIVLILTGIYRFVVTWTRMRQEEMEEE